MRAPGSGCGEVLPSIELLLELLLELLENTALVLFIWFGELGVTNFLKPFKPREI